MDETFMTTSSLVCYPVTRYIEKHQALMREIKDLQKQKGGINQKYEERYMKGISDIELSQKR